jgi:glutathione S-transferase
MKLHTFPPSPNSRKVELVAHTLGIKLEIVPVNLPAQEHCQPVFLALNPKGMIPVLQDGDFVLPESNAIMVYLAEKKPSALWPSDPRARAEVHSWLCWDLAHWQSTIGIFMFQNIVKPLVLKQGEPDEAMLVAARELLRRHAGVLDGHLAQHDYVVGPQPTLADFALAPVFNFTEMGKIPVEPYGHIRRWFGRIQALPAWKATEPKF